MVNNFIVSLCLLKSSLISNTGECGGSSIQTYIGVRRMLWMWIWMLEF